MSSTLALRCVAVLLVVGSFAACRGCRRSPTAALVEDRRDDMVAALRRARSFLDGLDVDPAALDAAGDKGKKHLVELLDAYALLLAGSHDDDDERAALRRRIDAIAARTRTPAWHDMRTNSDDKFRQDATSYLRACALLEDAGVDTDDYRAHIRAIAPRLDAQMRERGNNQRQTFHNYYRRFGLAEPFRLDDHRGGVLDSRPDPAQLSSTDVYLLTHEIFAPFDYGRARDVGPRDAFDDDELTWLRAALPVLTGRFVRAHDDDLVAELVVCLRLLELDDADGAPGAAYRAGLVTLLADQRADGGFGDVRHELHTTSVAVFAIELALREDARVSDLRAPG